MMHIYVRVHIPCFIYVVIQNIVSKVWSVSLKDLLVANNLKLALQVSRRQECGAELHGQAVTWIH